MDVYHGIKRGIDSDGREYRVVRTIGHAAPDNNKGQATLEKAEHEEKFDEQRERTDRRPGLGVALPAAKLAPRKH